MKNLLKLLILVLSCYFVGWVGSFFTLPAIPEWYMNLKKPFFNPPAWIFGPVWAVLYTMMGVAAFLVLKKSITIFEARTSLFLFYGQLLLNGIWSILFFGMRSPFYALLDILILWVLIFLTMRNFFSVSKSAGWLFAPYLAWVSFAALLNLSIVYLNLST